MRQIELGITVMEASRKLYIWLFWLFILATLACFILTFGFDFDYGTYIWLSLLAAFFCESRQQAAKGWIAGVKAMADAIRTSYPEAEVSEEEVSV